MGDMDLPGLGILYPSQSDTLEYLEISEP